MTTTPALDGALEAIDQQRCPLDGSDLTFEPFDDSPGGSYHCAQRPPHSWPVRRAIVEYDTNYFEAELDPEDVAAALADQEAQ